MAYWIHGEKTKLALAIGMRPCHLSQILRRKRGVSVKRAQLLETAAHSVLGKNIPWLSWLFNRKVTHPAFYTKCR